MARRFFDPLPRSVSETAGRRTALRESAWRFRVERPLDADRATLRNRSGVGIRHKTGARAQGVLYDREVIETGTRWSFKVMVDWRLAGAEAPEVEGILGYVLSEHWAHGRCWLGGDVARGFGWCHLEDLTSYRVSVEQEAGAASRTGGLPPPLQETPTVPPTKSWSFRTFDVCIRFGEYRPDDDTAWGVDTLSIGAHSAEAGRQQTGTGIWAVPPWIADAVPPSLPTDRVIVMGEGSPVIPGSSLRGAMRHAHSRAVRAAGEPVFDPHTVDGDVPPNDLGGRLFGTVTRSSTVLIRDAVSDQGEPWTAARFHMHAEDEFSAGSYGSAKRDAVRLLSGEFHTQIVVEGASAQDADETAGQIRRLIGLGELVRLPVGGHKTRGAGWGRWVCQESPVDVTAQRRWEPSETSPLARPAETSRAGQLPQGATWKQDSQHVWITSSTGTVYADMLDLQTASTVPDLSGLGAFIAWWCEPAIDFALATAPDVFGRELPSTDPLQVDEVVFFFEKGCAQVARTANGLRWVRLQEHPERVDGAVCAEARGVPARLHGGGARFDVSRTDRAGVVIREWVADGAIIGFTLEADGKEHEPGARE